MRRAAKREEGEEEVEESLVTRAESVEWGEASLRERQRKNPFEQD